VVEAMLAELQADGVRGVTAASYPL
jgi:hypothetical protein